MIFRSLAVTLLYCAARRLLPTHALAIEVAIGAPLSTALITPYTAPIKLKVVQLHLRLHFIHSS
jgi:hypothetical protein